MFRFIKTFRKWDKHHRGVSPVIAAILLIGLAVLAGAAVFFIVLPLLSGAADVEFSSISATDANDDGLVDTIKLSFTNSGTVAGEISEVDLAGLTGWSVTSPTGGTTDVNPGATAVVTLRPGTVADQIATTGSFSVVVTVAGEDITVNEDTAASDGKTYSTAATARTVTNSDLLISDYTRSAWISTDSAIGDVDEGLTDANRETGGGQPGVRFQTSGVEDVWFYNSNDPDGTGYSTGTNNPSKTTTWEKSSKPVVAFWVKSNLAITPGGDQNVWVYFEGYSGSTDVGSFTYNIESYFSGKTANEWFLVVIDFSDTGDSNWGSYDTDEQNANNVAGFGIRMDNNVNRNWDLYVDDIYTASGL